MAVLTGDARFFAPKVGITDFSVSTGWSSFYKYPRQVADVNGDGRADIIGFADGSTVVSLGQSNGTFSAPKVGITDFSVSTGWSSFYKYPRQVADVNGDDRADIIGFADGSTVVSLGQSNGTFSAPKVGITDFSVSTGWSSFSRYPRQVADVNGDGRADIIGFADGSTVVSLGQSNGTFGTPKVGITDFSVSTGWSNFYKYPRQVADVNGDGRADIIGFADGSTVVSLGQSNGTFSAPKVGITDFSVSTGWSDFFTYPRQVADVNGDGRADIIGFADGSTVVSLGQSNGNFSAPQVGITDFSVSTGWSNSYIYPRQVADVNGDGRADIIGFADGSTVVSLARTNLNDTLIGGNGDDTITGGQGKDILTGTGGITAQDTFTYNALSESLLTSFDIITDYIGRGASPDRINAPAPIPAFTLTSSKGTANNLSATAIQSVLNISAFRANTAAAFKVTGQSGTFIALNNGTAGFQADKDAIIQLQNYNISAINSVVII
jgi:hypothetical protein